MKTQSTPFTPAADWFPKWNKVALSTNQADPFCCTTTWQFSFHDAFDPDRRLLVQEGAGSLIAFAEQIVSPTEVYLTPIEASWFFGCPLVGRNAVDLLAHSLSEIAGGYGRATFPKIVISGIRPGGSLAKRLMKVFGRSMNFYLLNAGRQCSASLSEGVDGFMGRRSANHRSKLRKQARRLSEQEVYFERVVPATYEEAEQTYARMIAVELQSWKGIEKCGMAETPAKEFYDVMMRRLSEQKEGRIIFAKHEDRDIGFIFGAMAGKIYRGQQFSYVKDWSRHSIGNVMQYEKVKWLCEQGTKRYDMGPIVGPKMEYKQHWTERDTAMQTWILELG